MRVLAAALLVSILPIFVPAQTALTAAGSTFVEPIMAKWIA